MAKVTTTRVHILAKELGVKSNSIVEKCQAEGLGVKNHMSTITVGLAATIREWFSEGEHITTVEHTQRVDLKKVRVRKRAKKKAVQKVEPEAAEKAKEASKAEAAAEEPKAEAKEKKAVRPRARIVKPKKPKAVAPAGPKLEKPEPVKLSGPKVVRVEKVEPRKRRAHRPKSSQPWYDAPIVEPLMGPEVEISTPLKIKKGGKEKTHGRRKREHDVTEELKKSRAAKRRMHAKDVEERQARLAAARGETLRSRPSRRIETKKVKEAIPADRPEKVTIIEPITVKDLSAALAVKTGDIVMKLMEQGVMAAANDVIATEVAELVALELGTELTVETKQWLEQKIEAEFKAKERKNVQKRPPVVTMLGHVDHGKTSLLDRIRSTHVAEGEAGSITQHIGAYQIEIGGRKITFLDTPGHEAFTAMRARGANMTDIVVLVVAVDDGVMPQTVEAINHAKAAGVDIIVTLNKIDLQGVDINRIYGQLSEYELAPSEWGGKTEVVKTSAVTGEGIGDLIEHIDYMADLKDFQADSKIPAFGWVVEAKMTSTEGAVATVLIKEGQLKKGDIVLAGGSYGRARTLKDSQGRNIKKATSSMPVEITGLNDVPYAGDKFFCVNDINRAKEAAEQNRLRSREKTLFQRSQVTLDNLFSQIEAGQVKELNIILRADVQGSVDVLTSYLTDLNTEEVKVKILHAAVGGITEGDVVLAEASGAIIIGFNVVADDRVRVIAESKGIDIRNYNIIYRITEDLKDAMSGLLEPDYESKDLGRCVVREVFKISGVGTIAGCYVNSGSITKSAKIRLIRDNIVINDKCLVDSLKHFKNDVKEVRTGFECGIKLVGFDDVKVDDVFEAYEIVEVARKL